MLLSILRGGEIASSGSYALGSIRLLEIAVAVKTVGAAGGVGGATTSSRQMALWYFSGKPCGRVISMEIFR